MNFVSSKDDLTIGQEVIFENGHYGKLRKWFVVKVEELHEDYATIRTDMHKVKIWQRKFKHIRTK